MIRLVLFDIDGTLIRTGGAGVKAFAKTFASEFGIADGTERLKFAGRTDTSLVREFFTHHQIDPAAENFRRFFDRYVFWLEQTLAETNGGVLPGVHEWLDGLSALPGPVPTGLLTGNIRRGAELKLRHYGIWEKFQTGAFSDDHEDRNQIAVIAKERGSQLLKEPLHGDDVLVIGDTPHDIECARAIGARVLAVATGSVPAAELNTHKPDWLVDDLSKMNVEQVFG